MMLGIGKRQLLNITKEIASGAIAVLLLFGFGALIFWLLYLFYSLFIEFGLGVAMGVYVSMLGAALITYLYTQRGADK